MRKSNCKDRQSRATQTVFYLLICESHIGWLKFCIHLAFHNRNRYALESYWAIHFNRYIAVCTFILIAYSLYSRLCILPFLGTTAQQYKIVWKRTNTNNEHMTLKAAGTTLAVKVCWDRSSKRWEGKNRRTITDPIKECVNTRHQVGGVGIVITILAFE